MGSYGSLAWANQYDAAGNVTQRTTVNGGAYTYSGGVNPKTYNAGDTMTQRLVYDARNELVETDYAVDATLHEASLGAQQRQFYDADGHQTGSNTYLRSDATYKVYGSPENPQGWYYVQVGGWLTSGQASGYNADGLVTQQVSYLSPYQTNTDLLNLAREDDNGTLPDGGQSAVPSLSGDGPLIVGSTTTYTAFDHADNVTAYTYSQPALNSSPAYGANYTVNYLKKDGYLEQSTSGTATVSGYLPATDTSYYDDFGRRLATWQNSQAGNGTAQTQLSVFAYDAAGEIVQRRLGTGSGSSFTPTGGNGTDHYTYVNGQQVSDMDEGGGIHVADTLSGFSDSNSTQSYTVQTGDTLAGIAQAVYGNSQLGYVIADANGLSGDSALVVGQRITLPSITTTSNTANTFRPYNPNAIQGSTTPSLPVAPPPPSSHGCSALAEIIVVAVVVVAPIYTAGAAAEAFGATATAAGSTSTFAIGTAALSGGGLVGAGGVAIGAGVGIGAAAVGGFAGSVVGQGAGDALGISHGFSFGQALTAGLSAGLTAGIGSELSAGGGDYSVLANSQGDLQPGGAALYGVGAYASNVAAAKVTGQAEHFSWAGVVAAAVASGVTSEANLPSGALQKVGDSSGSFVQDVAGGLLSGGLNRETSKLLGDNRVPSWKSVGEDAFGNALGNATIAGINEQNNGLALPTADPYQPEISLNAPPIVMGDIPQTIGPLGLSDTYVAQQDQNLSAAPIEWKAPGYIATTAPNAANITTLPTIVVTANDRYNQDYANLWEYAVSNHLVPPPMTTSQTALNAYRSQMYAQTAPAYYASVARSTNRFSQPVMGNPYADAYNAVNYGAGKLLQAFQPDLHAYIQAGEPGGTWETEALGFAKGAANAAIGLVNISQPWMQGVKALGYDVSIPTFSINNDELLGASVFGVAGLAGSVIGGEAASVARVDQVFPAAPALSAADRQVLATFNAVPVSAVGDVLNSLTETQLAAFRAAGLSDTEIAGQIQTLGDIQLFRGTTPGYSGNAVFQQLGISSASTDPAVATAFALRSQAISGQGVVFTGGLNTFAEGSIDAGNAFAPLEREVQVNLSPSDFEAQASNQISANAARQALSDMGVQLPSAIYSNSDLENTLQSLTPLSPAQIQEFLQRTGVR